MGFSSIGAFIMLFFSLLIIISTFVLIYSNLVESTSLTYEVQNERLDNEAHTSISIENISFDNTTSPDTTTFYVKNTGSNKIDTGYVDVYIDNIKIPRKSANRSIVFAPGSTTINPLHWDGDETIIIDVYMDLDNSTHIGVVTTENGIKDAATFAGEV